MRRRTGLMHDELTLDVDRADFHPLIGTGPREDAGANVTELTVLKDLESTLRRVAGVALLRPDGQKLGLIPVLEISTLDEDLVPVLLHVGASRWRVPEHDIEGD